MSGEGNRDLESRIAEILPGPVEVRVTGAASLGAQRSTLFIDILGDGKTRKAVAQIASGPLAVSDVELEAGLMQEARRAGVAVPEILAWDLELRVVVTERVEGESIPRRILRRVEANPALGARLAADCGRALALLHGLSSDACSRLPDLFEPGRYVEELTMTLEGLSTPYPTFRLGLNWLTRRASSMNRARTASIVHGDFRNGNLLVSDTGLSAVLDWELAHRGDAMEDLAWLCLRTWRFGNDDQTAGGFAPLEDLRAAYEAEGGRWDEEAFRWWSVARTIWWGLGLARQAQAFIEGDATSIVLAASGRRVVELEYDLLERIDSFA